MMSWTIVLRCSVHFIFPLMKCKFQLVSDKITTHLQLLNVLQHRRMKEAWLRVGQSSHKIYILSGKEKMMNIIFPSHGIFPFYSNMMY